jgi:hypothetical protein
MSDREKQPIIDRAIMETARIKRSFLGFDFLESNLDIPVATMTPEQIAEAVVPIEGHEVPLVQARMARAALERVQGSPISSAADIREWWIRKGKAVEVIEDINERMAEFAPSQNVPDPVAEEMSVERSIPQFRPQELGFDPVAAQMARERKDALMAGMVGVAKVNPDQAAAAKKLWRAVRRRHRHRDAEHG